MRDGTARDVLLFWVGGEAENFYKQDWTGQISLNYLKKSGFRANGGMSSLVKSIPSSI